MSGGAGRRGHPQGQAIGQGRKRSVLGLSARAPQSRVESSLGLLPLVPWAQGEHARVSGDTPGGDAGRTAGWASTENARWASSLGS